VKRNRGETKEKQTQRPVGLGATQAIRVSTRAFGLDSGSLFRPRFAKLALTTKESLLEFRCRVESARDLSPSVFELTFTPETPFDFQAGQYISVVVPQAEGKPLRRPYSIASPPGGSPVELCIQRIEKGPGNSFLASLKPGDSFQGFAPYGFLVFKPKPGRDVFFIATGTGIAPFRSMLLSESFKKTALRKTVCLLGVRSESEILYEDSLGSLPGVQWIPCISQPRNSGGVNWAGRVTDYLKKNEIAWLETDFYLCGNGAMIDEVKQTLKAHGVLKDSIHQEIYFKPEPTLKA
jgi:CDP-4-dehydro-6-deoxyglucose reductase, E3